MPSPTQITVAQLSRIIGLPTSPIIIDVITDEDFGLDPRLIPSAFRHSFTDIEVLVPILKGKRTVVICQKGLKISQGAAAILRTHGIEAESLEGGNFAWRDAGLPLISIDKISNLNANGKTIWVTKHRPKIDRIACPWLIRRFIDRNAEFLFVEPSQVINVADKFDATAFDVPDALWRHDGDNCTFDMMLSEFKLDTKPLEIMADIIRGADTNKPNLAPEVAGLLAISLGLSRMYKDDLAQLDAGMLVYDALYRWARDAVNEKHDSRTSKVGN